MAKKRKRGTGPAKGAAFERAIAKRLSLWWTGWRRDDVFWRTASSGGRATRRQWEGQETRGQLGDLAATDPIGQPFIDLIHIELKRGYSRVGAESLLWPGKSPLLDWFSQADREHRQAKARGWWIIHRRDRQPTLLYMSGSAWRVLFKDVVFPGIGMIYPVGWKEPVYCMEFEEALRCISPKELMKPRR